MPRETPGTGFRPDLEGLRGVAILLVVLFHAGVASLAGGFVGVDVFFVLSGFFITGLLLREAASTGSINLTEFWGKRALRLLPVLLVVLVVTLGLVMWLYAPIDRAPIAANARAVALYAGNVEFARTATDYFGASDNPLLHTWSLAVEEQFYLVWPLLFVVALGSGALGRWAGGDATSEASSEGSATMRKLLLTIGVAGAGSFLLSLWLTRAAQPWAFFGMPTRIWEFALGGVLALFLIPRDASEPEVIDPDPPRFTPATMLQVGGLAAIAVGALSFDRATAYPGFAALLPALGAATLIAGGHLAPGSAISRVLSAAWLRWLGRVSYAWYLWHWPLVGVGAVLDWRIGVMGKLVWSAVALVLAWLTYRWIELPGRNVANAARLPSTWVAPAALSASVVVAVIAHVALVGAARKAMSPAQRQYAMARVDRMEHDCWATTVDEPKGPCVFGDRTSSTTLALLGDSHAEHWLGALDKLGRERGWKIVAMVKGGCPVAEMPELMQPRLKRWYHECTRYREAMMQRIVAMRPTAVILSSWDHYMPVDGKGSDWQVNPQIWKRGLRRTYERLVRAGITTVAIRGTPRSWFDVPSCLSRRAAGLPFAQRCEYSRARSMSPLAIAAQNEAASGLGVRFVDMNDQICSTPTCQVTRNGIVIFTDDNHLTASFSRSMGDVLGERLGSALK